MTGEEKEHSGFSTLLDLRCFERRSRRLLGAGYLFASIVLATLALTLAFPGPRSEDSGKTRCRHARRYYRAARETG